MHAVSSAEAERDACILVCILILLVLAPESMQSSRRRRSQPAIASDASLCQSSRSVGRSRSNIGWFGWSRAIAAAAVGCTREEGGSLCFHLALYPPLKTLDRGNHALHCIRIET